MLIEKEQDEFIHTYTDDIVTARTPPQHRGLWPKNKQTRAAPVVHNFVPFCFNEN